MMSLSADQRAELSVIEVILIAILYVTAAANISVICIRNYITNCLLIERAGVRNFVSLVICLSRWLSLHIIKVITIIFAYDSAKQSSQN